MSRPGAMLRRRLQHHRRGRLARARCRWVGELECFDRILDASGPRAGLVDLGYRHRPASMVTLDHVVEVGDLVGQGGRRFDAVFLGDALDIVHPADVRDVLHQVRDHLDPGGRLLFDSCRHDPHHLDELLLRHGYHVDQRVELGPGRGVAYECTPTSG